MNEVGTLPAITENRGTALKEQAKKVPVIVIEQEPDSFSSKITAGGCMAAGTAAAATGLTVYSAAKNGLSKGINWTEREIKNYCGEAGRNFKGFSNKLKANTKYLGAVLAALSTAALVFKDSDKDGKLDLFEAAQKFVSPE